MDFKTKRTRFIARIMLLVMLLATIFTNSCQWFNKEDVLDESNGLRAGFPNTKYIGNKDGYFMHCAYETDTNEFYINDVTLTFYYGGYYASGIEMELELAVNIPVFELYFINEETEYLIKRVEEQFISEKYYMELILDENYQAVDLIFNYSENITIPKELFINETGCIYFSIVGENLNNHGKIIQIGWIAIFYKKVDDKIILSAMEIS